jgi:hypothetical protein
MELNLAASAALLGSILFARSIREQVNQMNRR